MTKKLGLTESICLYSLLTAVTALSLDILLPVYQQLGEAFGRQSNTDLQNSVLCFVAGMLVGELVSGVLADRLGRRTTLAICICVFSVGTLVCLAGATYGLLLLGRALQGVGAAGQKICTRAIIRDRYSGALMAQVMSYVLAVFIALPFVAPAIGAWLGHHLGWRSIFVFLAVYAVAAFAWYWMRHPETLQTSGRRNSNVSLVRAAQKFFHHKRSFRLTLVAGLLFGVHLGFISLSPLMLAELYEIKAQFPLVFGAVVCAFGIALLVNAKLVLRFGMVSMVNLGLAVSGVVQLTLIGICLVFGSAPFFWLFGYLFLLLFSLGLIFGNLTALILEPMGDMAGVASAISSAISTSVALVISAGMGYVFAGELLQFIVPVAAVSVFAAGMFFTALSRSESPEYS